MMRTIYPQDTTALDWYQYLLGAVSPRPIAWVSSLSKDGIANLAPFSFFNVFSADPPIAVFSCTRRLSSGREKDTLRNVEETNEVVINMVSHNVVRQMLITSVEFPSEVSEFEKAGVTSLKSIHVKPFRVAESPAQLECVVDKIIPLGTSNRSGHLIICRILAMHLSEDILDGNRINPHKMDLMARMGRTFYARAGGDAIYSFPLPQNEIVLGYDQLPESVRKSDILTANNIAQLAALKMLPTRVEALAIQKEDIRLQKIMFSKNKNQALHMYAKEELDKENTVYAAKIIMLSE